MNTHNPELHRQHEAAKARRDRLWFGKPSVKPKALSLLVEPAVTVKVVVPSKPPLWRTERIKFDEHIKGWQWHLTNERGNKPKAYLRRRCVDYGIPLPVMIGLSRRRDIVGKRQLIMWEVHMLFGCSFPQLGRLFGGRDHTTALHAYRKIAAMTEEQRSAL